MGALAQTTADDGDAAELARIAAERRVAVEALRRQKAEARVLQEAGSPPAVTPDPNAHAVREAEEWSMREASGAKLAASARQRLHTESNALVVARRRLEAEANFRKHAILRAEAEAEAEQLARERIEVERQAADEYRLRERAESEAAALAKIRANADRTLAVQQEARIEAERALEIAAIDKTQAENEAAQQARRRETAEAEARSIAEVRLKAEREAETAAREHRAVVERLNLEHKARREAELAAARAKRTRLGLALASLRYASPLAAGAVALIAGLGLGVALSGKLAVAEDVIAAILPENSRGVELRLRLDSDVQHLGQPRPAVIDDAASPVRR